MRSHVLAVMCLFVPMTSAPGEPTAAAPRVDLTRIGSVPGAQFTTPTALNDRGQVVLSVRIDGASHAYLWTRQTGFELISPHAFPLDINNRGEVVGLSTSCLPTHCISTGFAWTAKHGFRDLGNFLPVALNERGDMAGNCGTACAYVRGELRTFNGVVASGINDHGDAVGFDVNDDNETAFSWPRRGGVVPLGPNTAEDINNAGTIVGRSGPFAVAWSRHGVRRTAPRLDTVAVAINASGWVAGTEFGEAAPRAFAWEPATNLFVHLGPEGSMANDINNRGEVVGTSNGDAVIWRLRR